MNYLIKRGTVLSFWCSWMLLQLQQDGDLFVHAFAPAAPWGISSASSSSTALGPVIKSEEIDFEFDVGLGGVRLAAESAIQVVGDVKHKPGEARPQMRSMQRFTQLTPVKEDVVKKMLEKVGGSIITTGSGKEIFREPGETVVKEVTYAPNDAVRDALIAAASCIDVEHLVLNFCGGDDLQILQVLEATEQLVLMLDANTKSKIDFTSLCHTSFAPSTSASVTVVALPATIDGDKKIMSSTERAIIEGNVYFWDGSYYTVVQDDINKAVA